MQASEDIALVIHDVTEGECEFIILSPSEPVKTCNFMQAAPAGKENMHFEISLLYQLGKNRMYSRDCTPDVAIKMFTLFYTDNIVPDVCEWKFEREFG